MTGALKIGDSVLLISFNGLTVAPSNFDEGENFWRIVGQKGKILAVVPPKYISSDRVLVQFDVDLDAFGLPNHNEIPNSLWIKISDVEADKN